SGSGVNALLERHANYTSIDRSVSYRPWGFSIDLVNHNASTEWRQKLFEMYHRSSATALIHADTGTGDDGNFQISAPSSAGPFAVNGGPGNISFVLNSDQSLLLQVANLATSGAPLRNSLSLVQYMQYWNGSASAA